jgi:hypothetical protein
LESKNLLRRNISKETYVTEQIRSIAKETSLFFNYLETNFKKEGVILKEKNDSKLILSKKISGRNIYFEFNDTDSDNFFELNIFSNKLFQFQWSNRSFLGLKLGVWLILLASAALLVPLIIFVAYRDTLPETWKNALLIIGIILMSSGVVTFILFLIINRIRKTRYYKIRNEISRITTEIQRWALEYSESKSDKKICWKCFKELDKSLTTCTECGTKL